jgi:hypothetical protein
MSVFTLESIYINVLFFRDKIEIYFDLNLKKQDIYIQRKTHDFLLVTLGSIADVRMAVVLLKLSAHRVSGA